MITGTSGDTWEVTADPNNPDVLVIHSTTGSMPDMLIAIPAGGIKLVNTDGTIVFSGVLDAPGMDLEVVGKNIVVNPGSTIDLLAGSNFLTCATGSQGGAVSFRAVDSLTGAMATDASIVVNGSTIIGSSVEFAAFGSAKNAEAVGGKSPVEARSPRAAAANSTRGATVAVPPITDRPLAPATPSQPAPQQPPTPDALLMTTGTHGASSHDSLGHADLSESTTVALSVTVAASPATSSGSTFDLNSECARGPPVALARIVTFISSSLFDFGTTLAHPSRHTSSLVEDSSGPTNVITVQASTAFASQPSSSLIRVATAHPLTCLQILSSRPAASLRAVLVRDPKTTYNWSGNSSGESEVFAPTTAAAISAAVVGAARIPLVGIENSGGSDVVASAAPAALSAGVVEAAPSLNLTGNDSGGSDVFTLAVAAAFCAPWPG